MIRLLPLLLLAGCVSATGGTGFDRATEAAALQRMRFVAEAVCLSNTTRASQDRAARRLGFPVREREGPSTLFVNPATLTFLRLGPSPVQTVEDGRGQEVRYEGHGCSVGSPAVGLEGANRVAGEILAPRLLEGDRSVAAPVGAGANASQGVGLFFDDLAVTVPLARTVIGDPASGDGVASIHPVVLVIHD